MNIGLLLWKREQVIPFQLKINTSNATTLVAFKEGEQMLTEPNAPRFSSVEVLFEDLDS